jgi:hypothetical protein
MSIARGAQRSERKSGEGNEPGIDATFLRELGARCKTVLIEKLMASGTRRLDNSSY